MPTSLIILYLALSVAGLFVFRGVPVVNVALGFPIGALLAWRATRPSRPTGTGGALAGEAVAPDSGAGVAGETGAPDSGGAVAGETGAPDSGVTALHTGMVWALGTAAVTVLICWIELGAMLLVLRFWGPYGPVSSWVPLLRPPVEPTASRLLLFAVLATPALQVLTTVFGAALAILVRNWGARRP